MGMIVNMKHKTAQFAKSEKNY